MNKFNKFFLKYNVDEYNNFIKFLNFNMNKFRVRYARKNGG